MNTSRKGTRQERKSMAWYEAQGFECTRASASKGPWDFIAMSDHNVVIVQVKATRWPASAEKLAMATCKAPRAVIRELHRWRPRARKPDVKAWIAGEWRDQTVKAT